MNNTNLKEQTFLELESKEKHLQKIKFCIVSSYKSQMSRDRLAIFALENRLN